MKIEYEDGSKLKFFQELHSEAESAYQSIHQNMKQWYDQYKGDKAIDGSDIEAKQIRNITYELIESQVTGYIPAPSVSPKMYNEKNERNAKSVETMLNTLRNQLPYEELNDMDERYSPIYGGSVWLVEWDESQKTHNTVGGIKLSCLAPHHFYGQPNIYSIDDMEYCFIEFETTKEDIVRKYGVSLAVAEEAAEEDGDDDDTATLIVCYYKDDDDKICEYIWSGDTELADVDDYYARKRKVCKKCGKREELCKCEKPKFKLENEEYEELEQDISLSDGTVIPMLSQVIRDGQPVTEAVQVQATDEAGNVIFDDSDGMMMPVMVEAQVPKMEKTKLPYYRPTLFPIVIRKNTSEEDSLFGQSDCEFIRPQQQGINKFESRIMEKMMGSGVIDVIPKGCKIEVDNTIHSRVLEIDQKDKGLFGSIDNSVDISRDTAASERLYDHAKRILGISDSFQGQYDSSAPSGVAKQLQIQQAQGRLDSKRRMKNAAHSRIDAISFQFHLAYADEPRPAAYKDAHGRWQNVEFNRYDFIERDDAGEYYYNDEYLFSADASVDAESNRTFLWQETRQNFQSGAFGETASPYAQLIFWQNMERAHYPHARENVERLREEIARQEEAAALRSKITQLEGEVGRRARYEQMLIEKLEKGGNTNGKV
jgi:hypothetical protein